MSNRVVLPAMPETGGLVQFVLLDWVWIGLFIGLMIVCGVIFYRLGSVAKPTSSLQGEVCPGGFPATSVYATHTATDTPMWITGTIYRWGMRGIWYPFFSAWWRHLALCTRRVSSGARLAMSQAEWQSLRYSGHGLRAAARLARGLADVHEYVRRRLGVGSHGQGLSVFLFGWPPWIGIVAVHIGMRHLCAHAPATGAW